MEDSGCCGGAKSWGMVDKPHHLRDSRPRSNGAPLPTVRFMAYIGQDARKGDPAAPRPRAKEFGEGDHPAGSLKTSTSGRTQPLFGSARSSRHPSYEGALTAIRKVVHAVLPRRLWRQSARRTSKPRQPMRRG